MPAPVSRLGALPLTLHRDSRRSYNQIREMTSGLVAAGLPDRQSDAEA